MEMKKIQGKIRILGAALDAVALSYFALYAYWLINNNDALTKLFITINPMMTGAYCMGIAMLVHFLAFRNILGRIVIVTPYIFTTVISFVATMGMAHWYELLIYFPHEVIILATIFFAVKQKTSSDKTQQ